VCMWRQTNCKAQPTLHSDTFAEPFSATSAPTLLLRLSAAVPATAASARLEVATGAARRPTSSCVFLRAGDPVAPLAVTVRSGCRGSTTTRGREVARLVAAAVDDGRGGSFPGNSGWQATPPGGGSGLCPKQGVAVTDEEAEGAAGPPEGRRLAPGTLELRTTGGGGGGAARPAVVATVAVAGPALRRGDGLVGGSCLAEASCTTPPALAVRCWAVAGRCCCCCPRGSLPLLLPPPTPPSGSWKLAKGCGVLAPPATPGACQAWAGPRPCCTSVAPLRPAAAWPVPHEPLRTSTARTLPRALRSGSCCCCCSAPPAGKLGRGAVRDPSAPEAAAAPAEAPPPPVVADGWRRTRAGGRGSCLSPRGVLTVMETPAGSAPRGSASATGMGTETRGAGSIGTTLSAARLALETWQMLRRRIEGVSAVYAW